MTGETTPPEGTIDDMARALVLTHSPVPGRGERYVGTVGPALRDQGFDVTVGSLVAGSEPVPEPGDVDVLVIMGSTQAAYDDTVPWLPGELAFLRRAIALDTPVLGICFGGQLLARALGGTVARAQRPELGFMPLDVLDAGTAGIPPVLPASTWMEFHHDAFTLPPGATGLARSEVCLQAFGHGPHLGLQFHPEISPDVLTSWMNGWRPGFREHVATQVDIPALVAEAAERAEECAAACHQLVANFCARRTAAA